MEEEDRQPLESAAMDTPAEVVESVEPQKEPEKEAVVEQQLNNVDGKHTAEEEQEAEAAPPEESPKEQANNVDAVVNAEGVEEESQEEEQQPAEAETSQDAAPQSVETSNDVEMKDTSEDNTQEDLHASEEVNVAEGVPQTEEEKAEQLRQLQEDDPFASAEPEEEPMDTAENCESVDGASQSPTPMETANSGDEETHKSGDEAHKSGDEATAAEEPPAREQEAVEGNRDQEKSQSDDLFDSLHEEARKSPAPLEDTVEQPDSVQRMEFEDDEPPADDATAAADEADEERHDENADEAPAEEDEGGGDEEVCLIPDEEREISEAEREALLAQEAAEKAQEEERADDDGSEENRQAEEAGPEEEGVNAEGQPDENDVTHEDSSAQHDVGMEAAEATTLAANEIREEAQATKEPVECVQCKKSLNCAFSVLQEGEPKSLCALECVEEFRKANEGTEFTVQRQKLSIYIILETGKTCAQCSTIKLCKYRFRKTANAEYSFLCDQPCLNAFIVLQTEQKCVVIRRKYLIEDVPVSDDEEMRKCYQCTDDKACRFVFRQDEDEFFLCQEDCVNLLLLEQPDRFRLKRRATTVRVRDLPKESGGSATVISNSAPVQGDLETFGPDSSQLVARTPEEVEQARIEREQSFLRVCVQCFSQVTPNEKSIIWETMDYCNETCLQSYQGMMLGSCSLCGMATPTASIGKYCVRFGYQIRQFCQTSCLAVFKKGLKMCSYCHENMVDKTGILAAIGPTQFKDFCSNECKDGFLTVVMGKKRHTVADCGVCRNKKPVRKEVIMDGVTFKLCCNACFSAFSFVNNLTADQCKLCNKYFERKGSVSFTIYEDFTPNIFCSKICFNLYIVQNRKIVPCAWCKVKKYNFDMLRRGSGGKSSLFCSTSCLAMYDMPKLTIPGKKGVCDNCSSKGAPQYHLTMSDGSMRNFCTYQCVMAFQSQFGKRPLTLSSPEDDARPVPAGLPKRVKSSSGQKATPQGDTSQATAKASAPASKSAATPKNAQPSVPVIAKVTSLSPMVTRTRGRPPKNSLPANNDASLSNDFTRFIEAQPRVVLQRTELSHLRPPTPPLSAARVAPARPTIRVSSSSKSVQTVAQPAPPARVEHKTQVVTVAPPPKPVANMATSCKPLHVSKSITCRPKTEEAECQTDDHLQRKIVIPIPVPMYVPSPMHMYSMPVPVPIPIPIPIPVPIFVPTTRNSAAGIMKEIKKIQDKMPTDPFEAELLMMAEMVAGDKKKADSDSESDAEEAPEDAFAQENIETGNAFGEDMLQMALKMATEYEEPPVDLESAMTANTITPGAHPQHLGESVIEQHNTLHQHHLMLMEQQRQAEMAVGRGRKRATPASRNTRPAPVKRQRRNENVVPTPPQPEPPREPAEKPDANMCLKYTFGVNAWKQWVLSKNADLEKSTLRRKPFKSDLLQLTADELNYSLCLFVKEVRKPNGSEYAPDTIYYLVLGIQQYLYENNRIDNIFTDPYYEKFTDCLDEVARKFSVLYNDSQYIVTRVEEEHLWECKQLGAHSPHVLLSTLMFFNTKHFNLTTVEEHMELSFSHIMKHWKRNPNAPGAAKLPGSRNVLLRFYPPQANGNNRKKRVYEQQENEQNPLRCPVKLYEFYLSKCPESVKTRNDIFYLQPERSCVPDSPVWYSTQALGRESLTKMLHRVKMVKEINIALLTS
ncbi:zinc finger MYM-type protein 4 isoform X2 [Phlebotomus argentipes]|uniref:zinc finger MYM-type protein 4 isoform X2 n=1 Tax=Phlebotomus argentipes TaxID=94469 RepID=UPI00289307CD|nr:zinc finger MYM-type protein 4 isoform X2 [Phlebotomus argentipes]